MTDSQLTFGFVCVQNAGRSQMSAAFAERERVRRGLEDEVEILTGGTDPAEAVHPEVVEAMGELDIDLSDRVPQSITDEDLDRCTVVATMGCSTLDLNGDVTVRDWALEDPHGQSIERVRDIRADIEQRVTGLFDEFTE